MQTDAQAELTAAIADLREDSALSLVRQWLESGEDPLKIVRACEKGLSQVGKRYEKGEYFLAGLVMGGEIFRRVTEMIEPVARERYSEETSGHVLLGTVQGDIHDLGKMMLGMLLSCRGFTVEDLGVDVSPDTFAVHAWKASPDIIGLSGMLTSCYEAMRQTVGTLREAGQQVPIIIGGGQVSAEVCRYVGADYWATDARVGVDLCQRLMQQPDGARRNS
jgi:methanogenic corrinoid protein MtbC1